MFTYLSVTSVLFWLKVVPRFHRDANSENLPDFLQQGKAPWKLSLIGWGRGHMTTTEKAVPLPLSWA